MTATPAADQSSETSRSQLRVRRRDPRTRATTRFYDRLAQWVVTLGGVGTIVAVSGVFFFLLWVALPLFLSSFLRPPETRTIAADAPDRLWGTDEYNTLAWSIDTFGVWKVVRLDNGEVLEKRTLFEGAKITALARNEHQAELLAGFADGSVRLGLLEFETKYEEIEKHPKYTAMPVGSFSVVDKGIAQRISVNQVRIQQVTSTWQPKLDGQSKSAIQFAALTKRASGPFGVVLDANNDLRIVGPKGVNRLTGKSRLGWLGKPISLNEIEKSAPFSMHINDLGDLAYVVWSHGNMVRIGLANVNEPKIVERVSVATEKNAVTAATMLVGKTTLVLGRQDGSVSAWFPTKPANSKNGDGIELKSGHEFTDANSAVTSLASSPLSRMLAVGHANGNAKIYQVTSERVVATTRLENGQAIESLAISPKEDSLTVRAANQWTTWGLELRYPSISFKTLFRPVWYEGYAKPEHVWQSSSGTDEEEPKLGLFPLIFGTLKATFYSMLFGAPIAILAAIFTSEFLHPRVKSRVKPAIELMASLPSVVLGFLAARVLAPWIAEHLTVVMAVPLTAPLVVLLAAHGWQLLPSSVNIRLAGLRLPLISVAIVLGFLAAYQLGPGIETLLFGGNVKIWLDRPSGHAFGGWFVLLLPISLLGVVFWAGGLSRSFPLGRKLEPSTASLLFFLFGAILAVLLAASVAWIFDRMAWDPRGMFLGSYDQRNALVVGIVMGFAIIPIIYTLSEDALSTVPQHLRSASLGLGATPWQTAVRVVAPTAMSGLFSALMVGLGRAVGETMIVLMATGSTPIMELNIFNGFRTLSANIAGELPEAVQGSAHYRILFLSGLILFALTFVLNTAAELVRMRFRRKAAEL